MPIDSEQLCLTLEKVELAALQRGFDVTDDCSTNLGPTLRVVVIRSQRAHPKPSVFKFLISPTYCASSAWPLV
jgi:hypothetical protein